MRIEGAEGVSLVADSFGSEHAMPVVLLGGLGQTRRSWQRVAQRIASEGRRAVTVDLRGHGDSGWSDDARYGYEFLTADLAAVVASVGGSAVLVGASLGGKISLGFAGGAPAGTVRGLVLVDTVPRTKASGVGHVIATLRPPPDGFDSPDAAADALAARQDRPRRPGDGERLARSMRCDARGRWHWHWDPIFLERDHGLGPASATSYLEAAAQTLAMPVLLVRGGLSQVVDDDGAEALRALIPQLEIETIPGARHMVVGDRNDAFAESLLGFLARAVPA